MKDFVSKPDNFQKIEFWAATTIYVFIVLFQISHAIQPQGVRDQAGQAGLTPFNYFFISQLARYTILYLAFLAMNFRIVPKLVRKEAMALNITLTILIFLLVGLAYAFIRTYLKYYFLGYNSPATHNYVFQRSFLYAIWLLLMFGLYSVIKYTGLWLLSRSGDIQAKYRLITPGGLTAFVLWMIIMFFLITGNADPEAIALWAVIIPYGILYYWYSFHTMIPKALLRKRPFTSYLYRTFLLLLVTTLPLIFIAVAITDDGETMSMIVFLNAVVQLLLTAPLSWVVYKRNLQGNQEIAILKTELGRSNASFDFLRSQINPHFLFNALNTIYGTAIQEKAERTSEGVERLGDMMRFMLQENMQEKIPLVREVEYLKNYIGFQKLRTDPNPAIRIEAEIQDPAAPVQIAPMLLIPFVENAFKHGISLREPSHIRINLEMRGNMLYFDVYNSRHSKPDNDPEKYKSGIGLPNVRQRLALLYPKRHELVIRETGREFFVHLTIQLS